MQGEGDMDTRLGNIFYGVGLAGAAVSSIYAIDAVWVHASGSSILPISGRFVSRDDMLSAIGIGLVSALVWWAAGAAARNLINRSAARQVVEERKRAAKEGKLISVGPSQDPYEPPPPHA